MDFSAVESLILSASDRDQGQGASEEQLVAAERELGLKISGGYRKFLKRFGWLGIGPTEVYGLGTGVPKHMDLVNITLSERTEMRPRLRQSLIPLMNDGGGNLFCIDATSVEGESQPVVFWDHDLDVDQTPEQVAPSFEDWLHERLSRAG